MNKISLLAFREQESSLFEILIFFITTFLSFMLFHITDFKMSLIAFLSMSIFAFLENKEKASGFLQLAYPFLLSFFILCQLNFTESLYIKIISITLFVFLNSINKKSTYRSDILKQLFIITLVVNLKVDWKLLISLFISFAFLWFSVKKYSKNSVYISDATSLKINLRLFQFYITLLCFYRIGQWL